MTGPRRIGVVLAVLSVSGWVWGAEPARQAPFLTISTLQQLRENYKAAKDYLPAYPVIMDGYWVIPGGKDSPRTFPNVEGEQELFSPNGDYVAVIRPHFYFDQQGELSDRVRFMRTDGTLMWYLSPAPWRVLPLDDGTSLGWASCPFLDMVLEVRSDSTEVLDTFPEAVLDTCTAALRELRVSAEWRELSRSTPTSCDRDVMRAIEAASTSLGYASTVLPSGAGHDAAYMARLGPMGMIFIPCRDGRSHCPEEWIEPAQLWVGARVLAESLKRLDQER